MPEVFYEGLIISFSMKELQTYQVMSSEEWHSSPFNHCIFYALQIIISGNTFRPVMLHYEPGLDVSFFSRKTLS
jgi:hypothetical protein